MEIGVGMRMQGTLIYSSHPVLNLKNQVLFILVFNQCTYSLSERD